MDIKKYISSGILEQYVLGLISEKDRQEVERYVQQYPELKAELDRIERALESYAEAHKMPVSDSMENQIMDRISHVDREVEPPKLSGPPWMSILLGVLLLAALGNAWMLRNERQAIQDELSQLQNTHQNLIDDCAEKDSVIQMLTDQVDILLNANNERVEMAGGATGTNLAPDALAAVFYNPTDQKSYFNIGSLPTPPTDRQYQLWALVDGNPVDMGVITLTGDTTLVEVPFIENAGAFAVTLETLGGNPTPDLTQLYVIGAVTG